MIYKLTYGDHTQWFTSHNKACAAYKKITSDVLEDELRLYAEATVQLSKYKTGEVDPVDELISRKGFYIAKYGVHIT